MVKDWNIEPGRIFTLDELADTYPRQWLAVKVVERDGETDQPLRVTVLQRSVDPFSTREGVGTQSFCTIYTGPIPESLHLEMF